MYFTLKISVFRCTSLVSSSVCSWVTLVLALSNTPSSPDSSMSTLSCWWLDVWWLEVWWLELWWKGMQWLDPWCVTLRVVDADLWWLDLLSFVCVGVPPNLYFRWSIGACYEHFEISMILRHAALRLSKICCAMEFGGTWGELHWMSTQHHLSLLCTGFLGDYRFLVLQLLSLTLVIVHLDFNHPWQYFFT